jgi:hypothetical protein
MRSPRWNPARTCCAKSPVTIVSSDAWNLVHRPQRLERHLVIANKEHF